MTPAGVTVGSCPHTGRHGPDAPLGTPAMLRPPLQGSLELSAVYGGWAYAGIGGRLRSTTLRSSPASPLPDQRAYVHLNQQPGTTRAQASRKVGAQQS